MLDRKTYVVKERPGVIKLTDTYDLLDAQSGQPIGIAKEEPPGLIQYIRLAINNRWLPTVVNVYERDTLMLQTILTAQRQRLDYFTGTRQGTAAVVRRWQKNQIWE